MKLFPAFAHIASRTPPVVRELKKSSEQLTTLPQQSHKAGQCDRHIRRPAAAGHIGELVPGGVNGGIERWGAQIGQVPVVVVKPGLVDQFGLDEGGEFLNPHVILTMLTDLYF